MEKYIGFSILLIGYVEKNYFEPLKCDSWNFFWRWGTFGLIIPYISIGIEYVSNIEKTAFSIEVSTLGLEIYLLKDWLEQNYLGSEPTVEWILFFTFPFEVSF
ncbi:MAG: hypothetical protein ACUVQF_07380 [Fervidobacterium sp.]|uniref:hypothetical protein n=1 Tax=Fervidobacterium sp. TaxID=1871331 RepID=UPI0040494758